MTSFADLPELTYDQYQEALQTLRDEAPSWGWAEKLAEVLFGPPPPKPKPSTLPFGMLTEGGSWLSVTSCGQDVLLGIANHPDDKSPIVDTQLSAGDLRRLVTVLDAVVG